MNSTAGSPSGTEADLHRRIRQQGAVAALGRRALETDDRDALLREATTAVAETLDTEYAAVLQALPGGDEVLLRQGVGWRDGLVGSATVSTGGSTVPSNDGPNGKRL